MIRITNGIIPFRGYKALTLWPLLFILRGVTFTPTDERHEEIHGEQQKEMLVVLFFILYGIFYLARLIRHGSHRMAYRNNPFEQEAYISQGDTEYLDRRRHYAWVRYIGKTTYNINS